MRGASLENCVRIRDLGYRPSTSIAMYGERLEIVSDPFIAGGDVVVQVTSAENPQKRILRLPVSILVGLRDLLGESGRRRTHFRLNAHDSVAIPNSNPA